MQQILLNIAEGAHMQHLFQDRIVQYKLSQNVPNLHLRNSTAFSLKNQKKVSKSRKMASPQIHVRSISLPSRLTNPTDFEVELKKLKSNWQISTLTPVSSEAIQSGLVDLAELYNSVEELTQSKYHQDSKVPMEESLSESAELLDSCSIVRELCQMIRGNVQSIQSALRRKGLSSDPSILQNDITSYLFFRKKMSKCIAKTLKTLKNSEHKIGSNPSVNTQMITGVTISILKSTLVFLSLPMGSSPSGWSFVSKLMLTKSGRENDVINEVGNADFALKSLQGKLRSNGAKVVDDVRMLQKTLQNLEATIQGFEEGLEKLNRQLIQSRVILLNILTDH